MNLARNGLESMSGLPAEDRVLRSPPLRRKVESSFSSAIAAPASPATSRPRFSSPFTAPKSMAWAWAWPYCALDCRAPRRPPLVHRERRPRLHLPLHPSLEGELTRARKPHRVYCRRRSPRWNRCVGWSNRPIFPSRRTAPAATFSASTARRKPAAWCWTCACRNRRPGACSRRCGSGKIRLPIIFITAYGDVPTCARAFRAGPPISGKAVRRQGAPGAHRANHDPPASGMAALRTAGRFGNRLSLLTPTESEILESLVEGKSIKEIARTEGLGADDLAAPDEHFPQGRGGEPTRAGPRGD